MCIYLKTSIHIIISSTTILKLQFISTYLTFDCLILGGPVQYQLKINGIKYLFWQIRYRYSKETCGAWKFFTAHVESRKGSGIHFCFPTCGIASIG